MVDAREHWLRKRRGGEGVAYGSREDTTVVQFYERLGYKGMPRVLMSKWLNQTSKVGTIGINVKLLRQIRQRPFALHRRQRDLCLKG
jgi:hypothetical protein